MAEFTINDNDLLTLNGKVVVLTGCSSGIGLATTKLLLDLGASVVGGDRNPIPLEHSGLTFLTLDVTSWANLSGLFQLYFRRELPLSSLINQLTTLRVPPLVLRVLYKFLHQLAKETHGRIDHVFACAVGKIEPDSQSPSAGIGSITNYLDEKLDDSGKLLEPNHRVIDINLKSVINTTVLAIHYMRHQRGGGSIVLIGSASSFQRYPTADYTTAKHGVLGLMRGILPNISPELPIRINCIGPSYTASGLVPSKLLEADYPF